MGTKFLWRGIPFITLLVGGSYALKYFAEVRYSFRKSKMTPDEERALKECMEDPEDRPTLEKLYQDVEKIDLNSWKNIRGPRPWEEHKEN